MRWPLMRRSNGVDRARYEQVIDQRDEARKEAAEHVCKIVELCGDVDALNEQLTAAREQNAELQAQLSDSAAEQWRAQARREKKRADRLQKQYDDAVGLNTARGDVGLLDSEHWKPPISLDVRPKPVGGAS